MVCLDFLLGHVVYSFVDSWNPKGAGSAAVACAAAAAVVAAAVADVRRNKVQNCHSAEDKSWDRRCRNLVVASPTEVAAVVPFPAVARTFLLVDHSFGYCQSKVPGNSDHFDIDSKEGVAVEVAEVLQSFDSNYCYCCYRKIS